MRTNARENPTTTAIAIHSGAQATPDQTVSNVAAKAAVNGLTKVVARENARVGVRCNVIAPGLIATDIADGMLEQHGDAIVKVIPLGRMGSSDEIGALAVYLASDDAAWITGKIFRIDGGQW